MAGVGGDADRGGLRGVRGCGAWPAAGLRPGRLRRRPPPCASWCLSVRAARARAGPGVAGADRAGPTAAWSSTSAWCSSPSASPPARPSGTAASSGWRRASRPAWPATRSPTWAPSSSRAEQDDDLGPGPRRRRQGLRARPCTSSRSGQPGHRLAVGADRPVRGRLPHPGGRPRRRRRADHTPSSGSTCSRWWPGCGSVAAVMGFGTFLAAWPRGRRRRTRARPSPGRAAARRHRSRVPTGRARDRAAAAGRVPRERRRAAWAVMARAAGGRPGDRAQRDGRRSPTRTGSAHRLRPALPDVPGPVGVRLRRARPPAIREEIPRRVGEGRETDGQIKDYILSRYPNIRLLPEAQRAGAGGLGPARRGGGGWSEDWPGRRSAAGGTPGGTGRPTTTAAGRKGVAVAVSDGAWPAWRSNATSCSSRSATWSASGTSGEVTDDRLRAS